MQDKNKMIIKKIIVSIISIILAILFISPFYLLIVNAFKTKRELYANVMSLPSSFYVDNFITAYKKLKFLNSFKNSLVITIVSNALIVIFTSMAAWQLTRTKNKISNVISLMFVAAMLIPFQSIMLPLVSFMGKLKLLNRPGLIFMYLGFGSSLSIFLFQGFVKGIPISLEEAAMLEGCNKWQTFWKVVFPMLKPMSVTVFILNTIWIWNDFLLPQLIINKGKMRTIPLEMYYFFGSFTKEWHLGMAGLTIGIIPVIIFYFLAQKQIIEGVASGAVK